MAAYSMALRSRREKSLSDRSSPNFFYQLKGTILWAILIVIVLVNNVAFKEKGDEQKLPR